MISFSHATTILMAGPIQACKTFVFKLILEHQLIQPAASRVSYVFGERAADLGHLKPLYPSIEYVQGMQNFLDIQPTMEPDERTIVVLDDQMAEAGKLVEISNIFTIGSHHRTINVVYIVQNVFDKGKVHDHLAKFAVNAALLKSPGRGTDEIASSTGVTHQSNLLIFPRVFSLAFIFMNISLVDFLLSSQ